MSAIRRLLFPLMALAFLATMSYSVAAQRPKLDEGAENLTPSMIRFLQDKQPAQNLDAQAATPCEGGFAGSYPCNNIDLLAFMPLADVGGGEANDIWGWTDPLTSKEYAVMGRTSGTSFVDISDPENPVYLGNLPTHTSNSNWRDVKVYADHAFVVSEAGSHGMQVFDLTRLRNVTNPPVTFTNDAHFSGFGSAHNVVINEDSGYAYGVGTGTCGGGLHMVDISTPTSPVDAGCFSADGYTHDAQCVNYVGPDPDHQGKEICFNSNEDTLTIVDVTNKAAPVQLSRTPYPGASYTHQGWIDEAHVNFYLDDEGDESSFGHNTRTRVFDVSDLDAPQLINVHDGVTAAIDHNMYVKGNYLYQANYRSGLRVLDITDPLNLEEAGFFDVYPSSDSPSFNGAWSTYPYFESGVVIISGIEQGLFIVEPVFEPRFDMAADDEFVQVCGDSSALTAISLTDRNGYTGNVTLSGVGLPAGAGASFSVNPVAVPGSSDLTVTTSGTPTGLHPFSILGDDGVLTGTIDMTLAVYDTTPGVPSLEAPANGATEVSTVPTLSWAASADASAYDVVIGTTPNPLANVVDFRLNLEDTNWTPNVVLDPSTTYYWAVRTRNACGIGANSAVYSFTTRDVPPVLLVDDDDNSPDVRTSYVNALTANGLDYDLWDTNNSDNEPDAATLSQYDMVLWFTGDEFGGAAGPSNASEAELASYLDNASGCLLISSQDYLWDRGGSGSDVPTAFMTDYLGMSSGTSDVSQTSVTGQLPPFAGTYSLTYPFTNWSDVINPGPSGNLLFLGNQGNAAIYKLGANYVTSYWGFPFESLPSAQQNDFLGTIYTGCQFYTTAGIDLFSQ